MIRWIFLDVGNVLLNEDPVGFLVFLRHVEAVRQVRRDRSFEDLLAERETRARAGSRWPVYEVAARYVDAPRLSGLWDAVDREVRARYDELTPVLPGASEAVAWLVRRFRLGLIANQPRECRGRLERAGLLTRFDLVLLSEEQEIAKPQREIFVRALDRAGGPAAECLMVGDRLDDDLEPASAIGMATAWIRWPRRALKGWTSDDPRAVEYLRSLERIALGDRPRPDARAPSIALDVIGDLPAAMEAWQSAPSRGDSTTA